MEPELSHSTKPRTRASALVARWSGFGRGRALYVLASLLLLVPVYWQPRIQAGDVTRHLHNAWLSHFIENGQSRGLLMVRETTEVLFDLMLSGLFRVLGAEAAQRVAVSILVLTFVWGAFAFVRAVSGRRAWHLLPSIAMLAYGWVFQMGFFNFYLSLGLCLWGLALVWEGERRRTAGAAVLLALAYIASAIPVAWTCGLILFLWLARRISPRRRGHVTAAFLLAMVLLEVVANRAMLLRWSPQQLTASVGVDQGWVFDSKYYVVLLGLLIAWALLFLELLHQGGARKIVHGISFHFCLIGATAVAILPSLILIPGFHYSLVYVAERMSLGVGVCVCALLAAARGKVLVRGALALVALVFFGFLYHDERVVNSFDDRMQNVASFAAPGALDNPAGLQPRAGAREGD